MFGERARIIFDRVSIFISACFVGVFAMSSEIVTGRASILALVHRVLCRAEYTRGLGRDVPRPAARCVLVASNLAKAGAMLETEGHEKHNGNREHEGKAENDEGERRGGGHGRKV